MPACREGEHVFFIRIHSRYLFASRSGSSLNVNQHQDLFSTVQAHMPGRFVVLDIRALPCRSYCNNRPLVGRVRYSITDGRYVTVAIHAGPLYEGILTVQSFCARWLSPMRHSCASAANCDSHCQKDCKDTLRPMKKQVRRIHW